MEDKMKNKSGVGLLMTAGFMVFAVCFLSYAVPAMADQEDSRVAGCQAIQVSPDDSLEMQQAVCGAAENNPNSSCALAGHGMCSAPKTDGMLPEGTNCICIDSSSSGTETTESDATGDGSSTEGTTEGEGTTPPPTDGGTPS